MNEILWIYGINHMTRLSPYIYPYWYIGVQLIPNYMVFVIALCIIIRHFYIEIIVQMASYILYLPACLLERLQSYRNWWLDRARTGETDGPYD